MIRVIPILFLIITAFGRIDAYSHAKEMQEKTIQKTVEEKIALTGSDQQITVMTDGSRWMMPTLKSLIPKSVVYVEDFSSPIIGSKYVFVQGYYAGYDETWTEKRFSANLLSLEPFSNEEPISFDPHKEVLIIEDIFQVEGAEFLLFHNKSLLMIPPHHGGHSIGDSLSINVMKNGNTVYFTRLINDEKETVHIPTNRTSSPYLFIAH